MALSAAFCFPIRRQNGVAPKPTRQFCRTRDAMCFVLVDSYLTPLRRFAARKKRKAGALPGCTPHKSQSPKQPSLHSNLLLRTAALLPSRESTVVACRCMMNPCATHRSDAAEQTVTKASRREMWSDRPEMVILRNRIDV